MQITAEDRFEIEQQIYRYAYSYDTGDVEGFCSVFTEDTATEAVFLGQAEPFMTQQGIDAVRAFVEAGRERNAQEGPGLHHTSSIIFDNVSAEAPRTRAMVLVTKQLDGEPLIVAHGFYEDTWKKTAKGWQIAFRRFVAYGYRQRAAASATS